MKILAPRLSIELVTSALEAQSLNQWTTKEVPISLSLNGQSHCNKLEEMGTPRELTSGLGWT